MTPSQRAAELVHSLSAQRRRVVAQERNEVLAVLRSVEVPGRGLSASVLALATRTKARQVHHHLRVLMRLGLAEHIGGGAYRATSSNGGK